MRSKPIERAIKILGHADVLMYNSSEFSLEKSELLSNLVENFVYREVGTIDQEWKLTNKLRVKKFKLN